MNDYLKLLLLLFSSAAAWVTIIALERTIWIKSTTRRVAKHWTKNPTSQELYIIEQQLKSTRLMCIGAAMFLWGLVLAVVETINAQL